jgi:predicted metal-binding membrane protein
MSSDKGTGGKLALRGHHAALLAAMVAVAGASWYYTWKGAWEMGHMDQAPDMFMPHAGPWTISEVWLLFLMWAVMMAAMMLPSVAPMTMVYANRSREADERPFVTAGLFLTGYLLAWTAFSALATAAQYWIHQRAWMSPMMISRNAIFGGVVLMIAGVFQLTSWKTSCLTSCRGSLGSASHWCSGCTGALRSGFYHGICCIGCCWALMAVLFVVGVMDIFWVSALTFLVFLERLAPGGAWIARAAGIALTVWAVAMLRGS